MSSIALEETRGAESFVSMPKEPEAAIDPIINWDRTSLIRQIQSLIPGYIPREDLSIEELRECLEWCWAPEY